MTLSRPVSFQCHDHKLHWNNINRSVIVLHRVQAPSESPCIFPGAGQDWNRKPSNEAKLRKPQVIFPGYAPDYDCGANDD